MCRGEEITLEEIENARSRIIEDLKRLLSEPRQPESRLNYIDKAIRGLEKELGMFGRGKYERS